MLCLHRVGYFQFLTQFLSSHMYTQRARRDPSNRRFIEHGILFFVLGRNLASKSNSIIIIILYPTYPTLPGIVNSQPVPSQAGADPTLDHSDGQRYEVGMAYIIVLPLTVTNHELYVFQERYTIWRSLTRNIVRH